MTRLMLTFDDGPDPAGTPAVLAALAKAGARATFFVVAPRAQTHPELVEAILHGGHEVAVHCDEHIRHGTRDARWGAADLGRALDRLSELGVTPTLWRTPWGDTAGWTAELARRHDLALVGWTVDTHDWRGDPARRMFDDTRDALRGGAIVLAHDGIGPGARRDDATSTAEYVRLAARCARERGLELTTVSGS